MKPRYVYQRFGALSGAWRHTGPRRSPLLQAGREVRRAVPEDAAQPRGFRSVKQEPEAWLAAPFPA